MSLILKCSVCDAKLPNQYAPVGGRCGGYVCKVEEARKVATALARDKVQAVRDAA